MTEQDKKRELARLEEKWRDERRKIKKYRLYLQWAEKRLQEIEEKIKNL